jgi:hypothetical protein
MASSPAYYERKEVHDGYQGSNMQFEDYGYAVVEVTDDLYFHMTLNQRNCTYERCNVSPSPTDASPIENSWMFYPLDKVSLGYFAPDRTIPSLNFDF